MVKKTLTIPEKYNIVRWNPEKQKGLVESYFLIFNVPEKEIALWLKWTFLKPFLGFGEPVGQVWAIYSNKKEPSKNIAIKNTYHYKDIALSYERFYLKFKDNELSMGLCKGRVEMDGAEIKWDLRFDTGGYYLLHFPFKIMYETPFVKNKLVTPHLKTKFYGWFSINGERIEVDGEQGIQGHNWGDAHSSNWLWAYSSLFDEKDAIFEIVSSRIKFKNIYLPPITILFLKWKDGEIFINKPFIGAYFKMKKEPYSWEFTAETLRHKIEGKIYSLKENFIGINYHQPDGTIIHCFNSMFANSEIKIYKRELFGFNLIETLKSTEKSTFEIGTINNPMGINILLP